MKDIRVIINDEVKKHKKQIEIKVRQSNIEQNKDDEDFDSDSSAESAES